MYTNSLFCDGKVLYCLLKPEALGLTGIETTAACRRGFGTAIAVH